MTDSEIRIAIAEACGYKWFWHVCANTEQGFEWSLVLTYPPEEGIGTAWIGCAGETREATSEEIETAKVSGAFTNSFPDYPNDLNAMHEAEKTLSDADYNEYIHVLNSVCISTAEAGMKQGRSRIMSATARQRAEAFLRTLGKWKP